MRRNDRKASLSSAFVILARVAAAREESRSFSGLEPGGENIDSL
jgi:hypothetical protein